MSGPAPTPVSFADFEAAGLSDSGWSWSCEGGPALVAGFLANDYTGAAAFALEVARAADDAVHHPDIDIRYPRHARVVLRTHETGGVSDLDLTSATTITALAVEHGLAHDVDTPR